MSDSTILDLLPDYGVKVFWNQKGGITIEQDNPAGAEDCIVLSWREARLLAAVLAKALCIRPESEPEDEDDEG